MNKKDDFKSITIAFRKNNEDVKEKIVKIRENTGKSKIDIICDAVRQYDINNTNNVNANIVNREEVEKVVKEILGGILLNNMSLNLNNIPQSQIIPKTKAELDKEKLSQLNDKKIDINLLDDDD